MGWGNATPILPYGKQLVRHRQMLQRFFSEDRTSNYEDMQLQAACEVLKRLLRSPGSYDEAFSR
jgi:cytochrome P450